MILTSANFAVIRQFILREGENLGGLGFEVSLEAATDGTFDTLVVSDPKAAGPIRVRRAQGKLHFNLKEKAFLEYHFAALISHISKQQ